MSVKVRIKKSKINECDAGSCAVSAPMTTLDNVSGMGNPIPPSENSLGSGDSFGNIPFKMATQKSPRYKLRKKHSKK